MNRGDIFRRIPKPRVGKNMFDLSHDHKTTFDMGFLVPVLCEDALPGDTWYLQTENFIRAAALLAPVMERIDVRLDYFFVPNRILWPSWDRWIKGELINEPPYVLAYGTSGNTPAPGDLGDYLGYAAFAPNSMSNYVARKVSAFPIAAYNMIWNEFYRHQNVQAPRDQELVNDDNSADFLAWLCDPPAYRNWQHDYFNSANPWPTAAGTTVDIPIEHAPDPVTAVSTVTGNPVLNKNLETNATGLVREGTSPFNSVYLDTRHEASIADLRASIRVQEWLEKILTGGGRLRELLYSFFGVDNMDMRLQVPELIGSSVRSMKISEVLSTAETLDSNDAVVNPVGNMHGHGISVHASNRFKYFVREHGWIIALLNVQPKPSYKPHGLHRKFTRESVYDYFWPQFANLGEQAIRNEELQMDATANNRALTFGYTPRYSEYKFINNRLSGDMATSLDFWHFANEYVGTPALDNGFLVANVRKDPFAVDVSPGMIAQCYHSLKVVRPIPRFSVAKTGG